jgi:4-hydroxybenzoate polyprenyltransferase
MIARLFHVIAFAFFVAVVFAFSLGNIALAGVILTGVLLIYEHSLVKANDLSKLNAAFFTTNGLISVMLLCFVAVDRVWSR